MLQTSQHFFFVISLKFTQWAWKLVWDFCFVLGGFQGHTHTFTWCEYFMLCVTAPVRAHRCRLASRSLSLSLRCSGEANELSLHMKPSSIIAYTHTLTHRFPCTRIEEQKQWGFNYILKVELLFACNMMFPCWYVLHIVWNNKALWNKSVSLRATIYFLELRTIWLRWLVLLFV